MKEKKTKPLYSVIRSLLREEKGSSQQDICEILYQKGYPLSQSALSRILRKMGAFKSKNSSGQLVYHLPDFISSLQVSQRISHLVNSVLKNETIIVVQTSPGSGQLIARILDSHKKRLGILGTVAGDDTVFVAPQSIHKKEACFSYLKELLED